MLHTLILAAALERPAFVAAASRCTNVNAIAMEDRLRNDERTQVKPNERDGRFNDLQTLIQNARDEGVILQAVCSPDALVPLAAELNAVTGWAYALESDIANAEYAEQCPSARAAVVSGFLATGWLTVATAERNDEKLPAIVGQVDAKLHARATAVQLTLPTSKDASDYWVRTIQAAGSDAAKACKQ